MQGKIDVNIHESHESRMVVGCGGEKDAEGARIASRCSRELHELREKLPTLAGAHANALKLARLLLQCNYCDITQRK